MMAMLTESVAARRCPRESGSSTSSRSNTTSYKTKTTTRAMLYPGIKDPFGIINIDVQPPVQVQTGSILYPPLVISSDTNADYDFVQVVVLDAHGRVLEGQVNGTLSTSKRGLDDGSSSSSSSSRSALEYCVFPDLSFNYAGSFTLRVSAIRIDYSAAEPEAVIVTSVVSREIWAYDQSVAIESPSTEERTLLRRLRRHGGFGVPRSPSR